MTDLFRPKTFMLVPTAACNASCTYCFAQKYGEKMSLSVVDDTIDFIQKIVPKGEHFKIIFHGGEPLIAGVGYYEYILPRLRKTFGSRVHLSMQSNLWALDEPMIQLIKKYKISIGTSLDGYAEMCDMQRGKGYYERTIKGIQMLKNAGIHVGIICTFAKPNTNQAAQVFERAENCYSIHGAVQAIGCPCGPMTVDAADMKQILEDSYHAYLQNPKHARISTIDSMVKGCFEEKGNLCTFFPCLGHFAAIAPDGSVYSCNRFAGNKEFCLGNVANHLNEEKILKSAGYHKLADKQEHMKEACGDCPHFPYCNGGCLYSCFASGTDKDPYCEAYRALFNEISHSLSLEMGEVLLGKRKSTPLLAFAGEKEHPYDVKQKWAYLNQLLKSEKLGISPSLRLEHPENKLHQVFLNLTYRCPLHCRHCSACADLNKAEELPVQVVKNIVSDAIESQFQIVTFTGGDPFVYSHLMEMIHLLNGLDRKGTRFQLRTSLGFEIDEKMLYESALFFDKITVSLDGDKQAHDNRRGEGRYDITVHNLKKLVDLGFSKKIIISAVLTEQQKQGKEWASVQELGHSLGIHSIVCRPLLPIGRNCDSECTENFLIPDSPEISAEPKITCGLGMNIHIEPNGDAYPCYMCTGEENLLGNVCRETLSSILQKGKLYSYQQHTVDTNQKCKNCDVRYLCGGVCRAWLKNDLSLDSGDFDCTLHQRYYRSISDEIKKHEFESNSKND